MNDSSDMGMQSELWKFDLHGQKPAFVTARMNIFESFIDRAPNKEIMLITGKGLHSAQGFSVVKDTVIEFCDNSKILAWRREENEGAITILRRSYGY